MHQFSIRNALTSVGFVAIGLAMWLIFPERLANLLSIPLFFIACSLAFVAASCGDGDVRAFGLGAIPPLLAMLICIAGFLPSFPLSIEPYLNYQPSNGAVESPYLYRQILLMFGMAACTGSVGVLANRIVQNKDAQNDT